MRTLVYVLSLLCFCISAKSQNSVSFYHLGETTYQSRFFNPAFVPAGKIFIGLPFLSGMHAHINNRFDYDEVVVKGEFTNQIDLGAFLSNLKENNMTSVVSGVNLLHLGYTTNQGSTFSFFINEQLEADFLYPKSLMEFIIKGNASVTGEELEIHKTRLSANYYRSYGIGFTQLFPDQRLSVGINLKYLQGFMNASTKGSFSATVLTDPVDYSLRLDMENATFRTSGLRLLGQDQKTALRSHLVGNRNHGMAVDLGANYQINESFSVAASAIDIGFISWREDIRNEQLGDTAMHYTGVDLKSLITTKQNLEDIVEDSLINKLRDQREGNNAPYSAMLSGKAFVSGTYHLANGDDVIATMGSKFIQGQMKMLFGAGYRKTFGQHLIASLSVTRLPQRFVNLGASLAVNAGAMQLYLAADQLVNYDATRLKAMDLRFGINIVLHDRFKPGKTGMEPVKSSADSFLGKKVNVKGKEGIYTIIGKQKRRKVKNKD